MCFRRSGDHDTRYVGIEYLLYAVDEGHFRRNLLRELAPSRTQVAHQGEPTQLLEVPDEVLSPVAASDYRDCCCL